MCNEGILDREKDWIAFFFSPLRCPYPSPNFRIPEFLRAAGTALV